MNLTVMVLYHDCGIMISTLGQSVACVLEGNTLAQVVLCSIRLLTCGTPYTYLCNVDLIKQWSTTYIFDHYNKKHLWTDCKTVLFRTTNEYYIFLSTNPTDTRSRRRDVYFSFAVSFNIHLPLIQCLIQKCDILQNQFKLIKFN